MVAYVPPKQAGKYKAVASGAITNGKPVIVNSTGTVTQISESAASLGTAATFENGNTQRNSIAYDSNLQRIVITYSNASDYGTAVVGTVSGSSISFGTPVVYNSSETADIDITFDSSNNKTVIVYRDAGNSNYGTAIVGTIDSSDNSISFGSEVVFNSGISYYNALTFDTNSNKVVVVYRDQSDSNKGTANVGTVSGTGISFGSDAVFNTASNAYIDITFDSSNNKVVVAYLDYGDTKGRAAVGTVSGTSISFGSEVLFENADTRRTAITFDSTNNKVVIAYEDNGNSSYGTAIVGTVSGTSISFGTAVVFNSSSTAGDDGIDIGFDSTSGKVVIFYYDAGATDGQYIEGTVSGTGITFGSEATHVTSYSTRFALVEDTTNNKLIVAYSDQSNTGYGKAQTFSTSVPTNLTTENYIGIASGGTYADTAEATIDVVGTVNKDQSGLTAGQTYYVQTDGTLGTSADGPSVVAGTAISATELIVKG
jgi:hypothetical protein